MALAVPLPPRLGDTGTGTPAQQCPPHRVSPCKVGGGWRWQPPPLRPPFARAAGSSASGGSPRGAAPAPHPGTRRGSRWLRSLRQALSLPPTVTHGRPGGETPARTPTRLPTHPPALRRSRSQEPRASSPRGPGQCQPTRPPPPGCFRLPLLLPAPGGEQSPPRPPGAVAGGSRFSSSSSLHVSFTRTRPFPRDAPASQGSHHSWGGGTPSLGPLHAGQGVTRLCIPPNRGGGAPSLCPPHRPLEGEHPGWGAAGAAPPASRRRLSTILKVLGNRRGGAQVSAGHAGRGTEGAGEPMGAAGRPRVHPLGAGEMMLGWEPCWAAAVGHWGWGGGQWDGHGPGGCRGGSGGCWVQPRGCTATPRCTHSQIHAEPTAKPPLDPRLLSAAP